ncbi:MAG: ribonuclease HI [Candidatus Paceibacterota bacterium]
MTKNIKVYTDGSSLGNPGPGGWGVVVITNEELGIKNKTPKAKIVEMGGYEKNTTNNRMELMAVIETLKYISEKYKKDEVTIFADSNYVLLGITTWIHNWEKNNWRTANKKPVLNQDLWKELIELTRSYKGKIKWEKVKGHSGHVYNDKADEIATGCANSQKKHIL